MAFVNSNAHTLHRAPLLPSFTEPPVFYPGVDPIDFMNEFKAIACINNWNEGHCLIYFRNSLVGDSQNWFDHFKRWNPHANWQNVVDKFYVEHLGRSYQREIQYRLMRKRQQRNESLKTYFRSVVVLCTESNKMMPETEILEYFIDGLLPEYLSNVHLCRAESLKHAEELVDLIVKAEDAINLRKDRVADYGVFNNRFSVRENESYKNEYRVPFNSNLNKNKFVEQPRCYSCGLVGHISRNCSQRSFSKQKPSISKFNREIESGQYRSSGKFYDRGYSVKSKSFENVDYKQNLNSCLVAKNEVKNSFFVSRVSNVENSSKETQEVNDKSNVCKIIEQNNVFDQAKDNGNSKVYEIVEKSHVIEEAKNNDNVNVEQSTIELSKVDNSRACEFVAQIDVSDQANENFEIESNSNLQKSVNSCSELGSIDKELNEVLSQVGVELEINDDEGIFVDNGPLENGVDGNIVLDNLISCVDNEEVIGINVNVNKLPENDASNVLKRNKRRKIVNVDSSNCENFCNVLPDVEQASIPKSLKLGVVSSNVQVEPDLIVDDFKNVGKEELRFLKCARTNRKVGDSNNNFVSRNKINKCLVDGERMKFSKFVDLNKLNFKSNVLFNEGDYEPWDRGKSSFFQFC